MPDGMKIGYVIGYVDGALSSSGEWQTYNDMSNAISKEKISKSLSDIAIKQEDFSGIRFGQYESGLDAFYQDFRNMSIHVEDTMPYVRDEIKGIPQKTLTGNLEVLRKISILPGYDQ